MEGIEGIGDDGLGVLGDPLVGAGGALGQLPLVGEEVLEEVVAPLRRGLGPDDLEAAGDGIRALSGSVGAAPAQTLLLDGGGLGFLADVVGGAGTVGLAEAVPAGDQGDGLLVVHGHAPEGDADVPGGGDGVGIAVGPSGLT